MLTAEFDERDDRRRIRRVHEAKFPRTKRLADFDLDAAPDHHTRPPSPPSPTGAWIDAGEPVVLLGDSGTGKTHLLIGLGIAACEQGRRVRYVTTAHWSTNSSKPPTTDASPASSARYGRLDLLCLDELGYVQLDPRGAELLFQIITEREEKRLDRLRLQRCRSANGAPSSPTPASPPPSSTGSPSTPTSSRPAPSPTGSAPARRHRTKRTT